MEHACLHLLEQALEMGEQELEALEHGRTEQASAREEERSRLTQQALELSGDVPLDILLVEFQKLCDMQKRLTQAADELRRGWRQEMARVRGESRRLAGYKQAAAHALN
ncbi:MAG: hypothetical protein LBC79_10735 [Deltaproteobacteria bacterium]|jgi:hypothetical protein|nr:hypothetical protein [Deltaproteobacteria bacterium]